jgi:hypothetical protein
VAGKPQAACRNRGDGDRKIQKSQIFSHHFAHFSTVNLEQKIHRF